MTFAAGFAVAFGECGIAFLFEAPLLDVAPGFALGFDGRLRTSGPFFARRLFTAGVAAASFDFFFVNGGLVNEDAAGLPTVDPATVFGARFVGAFADAFANVFAARFGNFASPRAAVADLVGFTVVGFADFAAPCAAEGRFSVAFEAALGAAVPLLAAGFPAVSCGF